MRILVACEFSGIVRDAFAALGHDAVSCDLLASETIGNHITGNVLDVLDDGWDLMIAHPPCTHLAVSGARWFKGKQQEQAEALAFVRALLDAPIPRIALENPVSIISTRIRKPDQIIQPLQNLPLLRPTQIMARRDRNLTPSGQNKLGPSPDRWKLRSLTYRGIADAMAAQWGAR
jgi:site-specific DNA-cytosine methylase